LYADRSRRPGIDDHFGIALAGLASDARVLSNFMKQQALSSKLTYGRAIPLERIVASIGDRAQTNTQHYGKRPYGVGLLIAGIDATGPHLYEFQPSGMTQEMVACAIGARSQTARTYLERNLDEFAMSDKEQLVQHGIKALKNSLPQDKELTIDNTTIAIIGVGKEGGKENFKLYDGQDVSIWLEMESGGRSDDAARATEEGAAMEIDP
jgi:20S proteasome subunit alpha 6